MGVYNEIHLSNGKDMFNIFSLKISEGNTFCNVRSEVEWEYNFAEAKGDM